MYLSGRLNPGRVRASLILAALLGLTACVAERPAAGYGQPMSLAPGAARSPGGAPVPQLDGRTVAILLPLTGSNADIGNAMLKAAQLALDVPGAPPLLPLDTAGVPAGARAAARSAIEKGAGLIIGPLTNAETAAVAPLARNAGIPVLAFTSDQNQSQEGVWTLGITPVQQLRRLTLAVQAEGRSRIGAVLPQNPLGDALSSGLLAAASEASLPEPRIVRYPGSLSRLDAGLREVSDYANRQPPPADQPADPAVPPLPRPPPPIDTLLLGAAGPTLAQAGPLLQTYDLKPGAGSEGVRVLGPGNWQREAPRLSSLTGAWFANPDPANREPFVQAYTARYSGAPRDLASLAYDAASLARVVGEGGAYPMASLMRSEGFAGADGVFALLPQGQVRRGLAVFEIDAKGAHIVQPAPQSFAAPGA